MPHRLAALQAEREAEEGLSDSSDEWTDEEDADTVIDNIDPFIFFSNTLQQLQMHVPARVQVGLQAEVP